MKLFGIQNNVGQYMTLKVLTNTGKMENLYVWLSCFIYML